MMIDDNKRDELELNFDSAANRDELESARRELAQEVAASSAPVPAASASVPAPAPTPAAAIPVNISVSTAPAPGAAPEPVLRSRMPINRPAGTPPVVPAAPPVAAITANVVEGSFGAALRSVREARQLDVREVEKGTQIAMRYIEAIEREDLDALPPLVYVIAYIRTLCRFYNIERTVADKMVAKLKEELEYPCNQELMNSLEVDNSGAEVNEKRLRQIFLLAGGAAVLVLVIIALVLFLVFRKPSPAAVPVPAVNTPVPVEVQPEVSGEATPEAVHFDPKTIYPLLEPATPQLVKLPVAE